MRICVFVFWLCLMGLMPTKIWAQPASWHCETPNLLLVVDTSGSMGQGNYLDALKKAVDQVVQNFKHKLRFGLVHFANDKVTLDVPIGPADPKDIDTHIQKLQRALAAFRARGNTPMNAAMKFVRQQYQTQTIPTDEFHKYTDPNAKRVHYVLLFTDGQPTDGDPTPSINSLRTLKVGSKQYDIKTYVVGLAGGIEKFQLNTFAQTGGTSRFYHAQTTQDLGPVFQRISQDAANHKEVCNNIDDNCDGSVDEYIQRECQSSCGPGLQVCVNGVWNECIPPGSHLEACDGHDNDCDGQIDESLTRDCSNKCGKGKQQCVQGDWSTCSAPTPSKEICDGIDNDCDGKVDEQETACPKGRCVKKEQGYVCDMPCVGGECISGFICDSKTNQCVELPCLRKTCQPGQICVNKNTKAECIDPCKGVTCGPGLTCGREGTCINCYDNACPPQMLCKDGACVVDRCANVKCAEGQACSDGVCLDTCADKKCPTGFRCQTLDGRYPKSTCFPDACANVQCAPHQVCSRGQCILNRCIETIVDKCQKGQSCDPETGLCKDDPCTYTHCPEGTYCTKGECLNENTPNPKEYCDNPPPGQCCVDAHCGSNTSCVNGYCVNTTNPNGNGGPRGSAGCACQNTPGEQPLFSWLLILFVLGFHRYKRRDKQGQQGGR